MEKAVLSLPYASPPNDDPDELLPEFEVAVADFIRLMPKSATEKDRPGLRSGRHFEVRDVQASSELISKLGRTAWVGARIHLDGRVQTAGMGVDYDTDPRTSAEAMTKAMDLMATELVSRHLL